jgi:hypothetical protein
LVQKPIEATDPNSQISLLNKRIEENKTNKNAIEDAVFPERRLQGIMNTIFDENEHNAQKIINPLDKDYDSLLTMVKQKEVFEYGKHEVSRFKKLVSLLRSIINCTYYPPTRLYIAMFYIGCSLLLISEIGFIEIVLKKELKPGGGATAELIRKIYAIGVSLSLAVAYKALIEAFWYKKLEDRFFFWLIFVTISFVQITLFSLEKVAGEKRYIGDLFTQTGFILGFFSSFFALANAILYRSAVHMNHSYFKLNVNTYERKINVINTLVQYEISLLEKSKDVIEAALNQLVNNDKGGDMIENIQSISISNFIKGFKDREEEIVIQNQELLYSVINKIKTPI